MEPKVIFENDNYLVISKPSGLVVHGDGKTSESTLVDWILKEYPEIISIGEPMVIEGRNLDRPGIVHRLDRETSGAMIIAKNQNSFDFFKQAFKNHKIQKEYKAFVWGYFKEASGLVDTPIGRSSGDFRRFQAGRGIRGEQREAVTRWQVESQFENENGDQFSFMSLFPKTGRTHQLRVHMKFLQRPIVSDLLYAPTKSKALGFDRVALHAHRISFIDLEGQEISLEAPYPQDFQGAIARYIKI